MPFIDRRADMPSLRSRNFSSRRLYRGDSVEACSSFLTFQTRAVLPPYHPEECPGQLVKQLKCILSKPPQNRLLLSHFEFFQLIDLRLQSLIEIPDEAVIINTNNRYVRVGIYCVNRSDVC